MAELYKNWKVVLMVVFLLGSLALIGFRGIPLGIDFKGGEKSERSYAPW